MIAKEKKVNYINSISLDRPGNGVKPFIEYRRLIHRRNNYALTFFPSAN